MKGGQKEYKWSVIHMNLGVNCFGQGVILQHSVDLMIPLTNKQSIVSDCIGLHPSIVPLYVTRDHTQRYSLC